MLARQQPEGRGLDDDPARAGGRLDRVAATAYVGWAVFAGYSAEPQKAHAVFRFLHACQAGTIDDAYVLALVANALLAIDPTGRGAAPYLERLEAMRQSSADGRQVWWTRQASRRTMFYGAGRSGGIETTALATLALIDTGRDPALIRAALGWLAHQRDAAGTWHSTQATILALKALLAGTSRPPRARSPSTS